MFDVLLWRMACGLPIELVTRFPLRPARASLCLLIGAVCNSDRVVRRKCFSPYHDAALLLQKRSMHAISTRPFVVGVSGMAYSSERQLLARIMSKYLKHLLIFFRISFCRVRPPIEFIHLSSFAPQRSNGGLALFFTTFWLFSMLLLCFLLFLLRRSRPSASNAWRTRNFLC